ncbi:TRAP transporter small permease [Chelatococcus reniformis]|uniref:TRAP transporter small permease protein n=1 Tax=Chelatococcus reniformis TaxID=1494448 RepID=A0A916U748_9HYPH|nr:TRAP transporter small permease [Chelatococcus reniformis]GGC62235.1 ABC transporter permease [Chelatococcus reniformis]
MSMVIDGYFKTLKLAAALLLATMVLLVFGNVVLRYAFNSGIAVSEELSRWCFVWLVFTGAIVGMREGAHLGLDSFVKLLPTWGKKACFGLSGALMLFATVLLGKGSWEQTLINWDTAAPASGLSVGWFYLVGVVFSISVGLILAVDLARLLIGGLRDTELVAVKESEEL